MSLPNSLFASCLLMTLLCLIFAPVPTHTKTIFEFTRLLDTCDAQDNPVPTGAAKVVWAYNDALPADEDSVAYHQDTRGQSGIRLRNSGNVPLPPDVTTFNLTVINTTIPFNTIPQTTYYCKVFALPTVAEGAQGTIIPTQIIKWEPIIQPENVDVIHHMLSFECPMDFDASFVNWQGDCNENPPYAVQTCMAGNVFSAWAVGGLPYYFPANVGLPMNNNTTRYVMLETHYNNQNQRKIVDNSGMRFYRTQTLRQYDGGILGAGMPTMPNFFIPPQSQATTFESYCIPQCTDLMFPPQGITIVGTILHSHLAGRSLSLRHIRNGFEFAPIATEPFYDFNFQDIDVVYPPRVVLPGDLLITTCTYNTMDRTANTVFGLSTYNEMCLSYSVYYPRIEFTYCQSGNFSKYPFLPPVQWYPNDTLVFCANTGFSSGDTDLHIDVTVPYFDNCTYKPPAATRTTPVALSQEPDLSGYQNHQVMDDNGKYNLHWSVNLPTNEIMFAVEVETDGWVGLGISQNGGMIGSDVSIGYIGADGSANHKDRFAVKHALPPIDTLQDYYDIRGYNSLRSSGGGNTGGSTGDDSSDSKPIMTTARIIGISIAGALACGLAVVFCVRRQRNSDTSDNSHKFASLNANDSDNTTATAVPRKKATKHADAGTGGGSYYAVPDGNDEENQTAAPKGAQSKAQSKTQRQQERSPRDTYEEQQYRDEYPSEATVSEHVHPDHDEEEHNHSHGGHDDHDDRHSHSEDDQEDDQEQQRRHQEQQRRQQRQVKQQSGGGKKKRPSRPAQDE